MDRMTKNSSGVSRLTWMKQLFKSVEEIRGNRFQTLITKTFQMKAPTSHSKHNLTRADDYLHDDEP